MWGSPFRRPRGGGAGGLLQELSPLFGVWMMGAAARRMHGPLPVWPKHLVQPTGVADHGGVAHVSLDGHRELIT